MIIECECGEKYPAVALTIIRHKAPLRINTNCPECGRGYLLRLDRNRDADDLDKVVERIVADVMGDDEDIKKSIRKALDNL